MYLYGMVKSGYLWFILENNFNYWIKIFLLIIINI